jgi:hypothetical protein
VLIVVTGLPGSGKSTLSLALADRPDLPLIAKDDFKELLFGALGVGDRDWSARIGRAAIALQYDAMATVGSAVVDSALWTGVSEPESDALGLPVVQVYCDCTFAVARDRYFRWAAGRDPGYREDLVSVDDCDRFRPLTEPLRPEAPLIRVDTRHPVDLDAVVAQIEAVVA